MYSLLRAKAMRSCAPEGRILVAEGFYFSREEICGINALDDEARFSQSDAHGVARHVHQWIYDPLRLPRLVWDFGVVRGVGGLERQRKVSDVVFGFGGDGGFGCGGAGSGMTHRRRWVLSSSCTLKRELRTLELQAWEFSRKLVWLCMLR